MIEKEEAEKFLPLVNDVATMQLLQEYAAYRIKVLQKSLENLNLPMEIHRVQGHISELRRFTTLKDEVTVYNKKAK